MDSKYAYVNKMKSPSKSSGNSFNGFSLKRKSDSQKINHHQHSFLSKKIRKDEFKVKIVKKQEEKSGFSTCKQQSNGVNSVEQQRQMLPVNGCKQRIIHEVQKSDTLVIMGETGSGKTTQFPQILMDAGYCKKGLIVITQPRRVAAITVAKRVSQEVGCQLGQTIGYSVRFEDCTTKSTKIKFATDGTLLREALSDRLLKNYSVVILDEAHERTVNTDVLFGIVKEAQRKRRERNLNVLKIIVTSATMDIDNFANYFGVRGMYLEGKMHTVRLMHAIEKQDDYTVACLRSLFDIHQTNPPNQDILIFLTGQEEIEAAAQRIRNMTKSNLLKGPTLRVFTFYSQMPQNKQLEVFIPSGPNSRKVILATNIAESSVTIPGIRFVIDSGFEKRRVYDPSTGMDTLKVVRISRANAWQRSGRAGREAPGICYRIYTKEQMSKFAEMPTPEILRSNISATILQLLTLEINCSTFDFMDKPSPEAIEKAYKQLYLLGAIKSIHKPELTQLGRKMAMLPLDPHLSKLLLSAPKFGCLDEMLSLVAVLSGENIFITSTEKKEQAALAHAKFQSKFGDHLTLLNVYNAFRKTDKFKLWCHDNFLHTRNLLYARNVRNQLGEICERLKMPISSCGSNVDQVRKCLIAGLFNNIAELQKDNFYAVISSRNLAKIHPSSVLSGKSRPSCVVFTEIVVTERTYIRLVTIIDPEWIEEIIPNYPYVKRLKKY